MRTLFAIVLVSACFWTGCGVRDGQIEDLIQREKVTGTAEIFLGKHSGQEEFAHAGLTKIERVLPEGATVLPDGRVNVPGYPLPVSQKSVDMIRTSQVTLTPKGEALLKDATVVNEDRLGKTLRAPLGTREDLQVTETKKSGQMIMASFTYEFEPNDLGKALGLQRQQLKGIAQIGVKDGGLNLDSLNDNAPYIK